MPSADRGEVWLADLGYAAKIRPCLVLSVPPDSQDRVLVTLVSHTTSVQGTRFEVVIPKRFLKAGAFDAQGLVTVASARLIRKLGKLQAEDLASERIGAMGNTYVSIPLLPKLCKNVLI